MASCKSTQKITATQIHHAKAEKVVRNAKQFLNTPYKYGGVTKRGMDCSGLVYTIFQKENIKLPRVSREMAKQGKNIPLKRAKKGDLIFFSTGKTQGISHVGLVTSIKNGQVFFIHSSTKRGVIISSINEPYYKNTFVKVQRILF